MNEFANARKLAGLSVFEACYLLNTGPRTLRRWENMSTRYNAPERAVWVMQEVQRGLVSPDWYDWRGHGVNPKAWRPVRVDGSTSIDAAFTLRADHGADALAKLQPEK
jgi:hypothetical protein